MSNLHREAEITRNPEASGVMDADSSATPRSSGEARPLFGLPARYEELGLLARGGFGEVRRVRDTLLDRTLVMKLLHAELCGRPSVRRRFFTEVQITAQLQHPGIVPVHDHGELEDGRLWYTMKEVRGATFGAIVRDLHAASTPDGFGATASGWTFRRTLDALARVAQAVAYAHGQGVIHRDLKPENLMIGELGEVLVMDWGLARRIGRADVDEADIDPDPLASALPAERTRHGDVLGTPAYMPPEQARGERDRHGPHSDTYALGAILYHLLSGRAPYSGDGALVIRAILAAPPPLVELAAAGGPPVPAELARVCGRAMAHEIEARGAAEELAQDLFAWLDGVRRREHALAALSRARAGEAAIAAAIAAADATRARARVILGALKPFDPIEKKRPAWDLEDEAGRLSREAALAETRWIEAVHGALSLDPALPEAHAALADHYRARLVEAERGRRDDDAARFEVLLRAHDRGRHAAFLRGDGAVSLVTDPEGASVTAERYEARDRRLSPVFFADLGRTPLREVALPHGSYLLRLRAPGRAEVRYPVLIERGEHWDGCAPGERAPRPIALPEAGEIGPEECYVPAGWAWTGGDPEAADSLPRRRIWIEGFMIGRTPVTIAEYVAFLNDLVEAGREAEALAVCPKRQLGAAKSHEVLPALDRGPDGRYTTSPNWALDLPVVLVDWHAASAYARWLSARRRRPFRLPNELERERAARGADGRFAPWGNHMDALFACVAESHTGPPALVAVGAFPADESPYGVRGLSGNTRDWCVNAWKLGGPAIEDDRLQLDPAAPDDPDYRVIRGGAWGSALASGRAAARFGGKPERSTLAVGVRIGRSWPPR